MRKLYIQSELFGDPDSVHRSMVLLVITYLLTATAWMAAWVAISGRSPGKFFLGLKVVDVWTQSRPRPFNAFLRSITFILSIAGLGLPWLAVLTNPKRRPIHDRVADTVVVTQSIKRRALLPSLSEVAAGSALHIAGLGFLSIMAVLILDQTLQPSEKRVSVNQCELIDDGLSHYHIKKAEYRVGVRLDLALALELASLIGSDCLISESNRVLWSFAKESERARAFLARGLGESSDEKKRKYFEQVCAENPDDDACTIAKYELSWLDGTLENPSVATSLQPSSEFGKVWKMSRLLHEGSYQKVIDSTPFTSFNPLISEFSETVRAQALKRSGLKAELIAVASHQFWKSSRPTKNQWAKMSCPELAGTCAKTLQAICKWYIDNNSNSHTVVSDEFANILYNDHRCNPESQSPKLEGLWAEVFVAAHRPEKTLSYDRLSEIEKDSWPSWAGYHARTQLLEGQLSASLLEKVQADWSRIDPDTNKDSHVEIWEKLGEILFYKNRQLGRNREAASVGNQILSHRLANKKFVAEYRQVSYLLDALPRLPASDSASKP